MRGKKRGGPIRSLDPRHCDAFGCVMVRSSDKGHLLHLPRATGLCGRIPLAIPSCGGGAAMQERADSTELGRPTLLHPALRRLAQVLRCGPLLSPLPASNLFLTSPASNLPPSAVSNFLFSAFSHNLIVSIVCNTQNTHG
jgi:hypothetical protein